MDDRSRSTQGSRPCVGRIAIGERRSIRQSLRRSTSLSRNPTAAPDCCAAAFLSRLLRRARGTSTSFVAETISDARFGQNDLRRRGVALDLGAELADEDAQILRVVLMSRAPYGS